MDVSQLLLYDGTTFSEYNSGLNFEMKKEDGVLADEETGLVLGFPAKNCGVNERPWFNYIEGTMGCTCKYVESVDVVFCRHIVALFNGLDHRKSKYGDMFLEKYRNNLVGGSIVAASGYIPTGLPEVDDMLGGGIPRSVFVLFCGISKIGKTWFGIQAACHAATKGFKVLYFDNEGMFQRPDSFPTFERILRNRWDYEGPMGENIKFITKYKIEEIGPMFGHKIHVNTYGNKVTANTYRIVNSYDETPIYKICKAENIDLLIYDSFTKPLKSRVPTSASQNFPGRSDIINQMFPAFEEIARGLGLAFLCIAHSVRNYDFDINELLDQPVTLENFDVWGSNTLMHQTKYFLQLERCRRPDCKGKSVVHLLRRLWSGMKPTHVDLQFREDWGFTIYE